ncbi:MAG: hypothetical protein EOP11_12515 [Proteobacteria bacterium]|nr:MAG: hypothetical protein EOP11_12515 [Pseudomonadota bacterium]
MKSNFNRLMTTGLFFGLLSFALAACGDEQDSRISDDDALCLKIIRNGGTCGGAATSATSTVTVSAITTTTTTDTSTVTVTSTSL